jgi:hypothetical protein
VERFACPGDRLTPHNLHIVGELAAVDHDSDGRDGSDLQAPVRFDEASGDAAVEQAHTTLAREHTQSFIQAGVIW